jgi:ABC-2 type transport system ATP-binding protein
MGTDSRRLEAADFQQIGYVSENQEMPEWMTVEYLMAYLKPFYPTWDDGRARELLDQFDLPKSRKLKHLSRGMRMKAALASSLAYRPKLLVLDEPFTGLDPLVRDEFVEGLIASAEETTMLISSHDLAEVETFATHIGFLDRGRLQFSESMSALSDRFREIEITLGDGVSVPSAWPDRWLRLEMSSRLVRFVDPNFDADGTPAEIRRVLGTGCDVTANAMSLRSIFVTLARESRKAA